MFAIIILFVFILVILLSIAMVKSKVDCLKRQDEHIEESANDKLEFDNYAQTFTVNDKDCKTYRYEQIVDFELLENGSVIDTALGLREQYEMNASSINVGLCSSLVIKIILRDSSESSIYVSFIDGKPVRKDSYLYQTIYMGVQNTLSKLELAMDQVSDKPQTSNISGADEIVKYKKLLDEGIISQEEFETKKTQILNRG